MSKSIINLVIDGNEANVANRVGSNVYAFEIIGHLHQMVSQDSSINVTVLLAHNPVADWPKQGSNWQYKVIGPTLFWTQWALPIYLFKNRKNVDLLFNPGHYAPRFCPVPYITSVMDTAYLDSPQHFTTKDLLQLKTWTKFSVKNAQKVIVISQATKKSLVAHYKRKENDVVVVYPAIAKPEKFAEKLKIDVPYFLYLGTIQPRKNIEMLIEAFEIFVSRYVSNDRKSIKLVIAGKKGWLCQPIIDRIEKSNLHQQIIVTGFISEAEKNFLLREAVATVLLSEHEGFGLPPLESMSLSTPTIVADARSLPEVVGNAGFLVHPVTAQETAKQMQEVYELSKVQKLQLNKKMRAQVASFSWKKSAQIVLETIKNESK